MKRIVNLKEATDSLQKFTGVKANLHEDASTRAHTYIGDWEDFRFAPMKFWVDAKWSLDKYLRPICPFAEVCNPSYLTYMGIDSYGATYVAIGQLIYTLEQHDFGTPPSFTVLPAEDKKVTHFFIMQQRAVVNDAHKGYSDWQEFPLNNSFGHEEHPDLREYTAWQATSVAYDGSYWQFYLLPVGYCTPPISENRFWMNYLDNIERQEFTSSITKVIKWNRNNFVHEHISHLHKQEVGREWQRNVMEAENQRVRKELYGICAELNKRIDVLRKDPMCSDLVPVIVCGDKLSFDCEGGKIYDASAMQTFIENREARLKDYRNSIERINQLEDTIKNTLHGTVDTTNLKYFEVALPKPMFAPNEPANIVRRFAYNDFAIDMLREWLDAVRRSFSNALKHIDDDDNFDDCAK